MHSESTKRNIAYRLTILLTAALASALCAIGPREGYAGELEDLQAEFGVLDPEALLAECRAQQQQIRNALPELEDIQRKESELLDKFKRTENHQFDLEKRIRELNERISRQQIRRDQVLSKCRWDNQSKLSACSKRVDSALYVEAEQRQIDRDQCHADAESGEKECLQQSALGDEVLQADRQAAQSLEGRLKTLNHEMAEVSKDVSELYGKRIEAYRKTGIDPMRRLYRLPEETGPTVSRQVGALAARCDRLEKLAKLKRALRESPQAAEPPAKPAERKDVDKLAQEADAAVVSGDIEKAKKLAKELADETGADDPRTKKVIDDLGRETEARQVVAEAKRRYDEATLLDIVDEPAQSAEAYRVAMSLLQEAREKTSSPERREKIDQAIARVVQRIADLPEAGTPQAGANGLMAAQRAAGNRECSEKYRDSIFVKADPVTGGYFCGCRSGSTWNSDRTACVKATGTLARASCSKSFPGSVPAGFKNGVPQCGCPSGRVWNSSRTACVPGAQTAQGLDPQVAYELGALLGQVLRSRSRQPPAGCHYRPGTRELHCGGG